MPKILIDNTKNIQPERTYAIKTCPVCRSVIEIFESEVRDAPVDKNGFVQFKCFCGKEIALYKYFSGKRYDDDDCLRTIDYFQNQVKNILWDDLRYIPVGYYTEYFTLNHTEMIINPLKILLKVYIDRYENGNWEKCISENEFYKEFKFNLCLLSSDISKCARYSQALQDYVIYSLKNACLQVKGDTDLKLQIINDEELIAYFRNADLSIDQNEIYLAMYERLGFK